jgi:signal transduction histidine kinase
MAVGYVNGQQQVHDRMDAVTALKALSIKAWADTLQTGLLTVSSDQYASQRVSVVLGLAKLGKSYLWYDDALRVRLHTYVEQSGQFEEICLLDVSGAVVLCTSGPRQTVDDCGAQAFFQAGSASPFTEIVFPLPAQESQNQGGLADTPGQSSLTAKCDLGFPRARTPVAVIARPVTSSEGESLGVIVGRASSQGLVEILANRSGLGSTGKAYLVSPSLAVLSGVTKASISESNTMNLERRLGAGADAALSARSDDSGIYADSQGGAVLGTYRWLPDLLVVLAVEQSLSEAFSGILQGLALSLAIALASVLVAVGVSVRITRSITDPLVSLVDTATEIAGGNLERTAPVVRNDEIGSLATAFNSMTAQLRDLIGHLEQRVQARTRALHDANEALQRRALQMETSAQVSRQITSILEIDALLTHVVDLIRDAFGFSHARIFLLDAETLVQRSNTGDEATAGVRLPVGLISLNTEAVRTGQAVVVNDVTQDSRFLKEEPLQDTRSELAVPLRVGDRVIGTLDVLSDKFGAFTSEELLVVQSLADQIAIAIENARLYARSRDLAVLEERNRLARDLHDSVNQSLYSLSLLFEGWRRLLRSGEATNPEEYFDRADAIAQQALMEMRLMVYELRPTAIEQDGLLSALRRRLDAVDRRGGMKTRLIAEDLIDLPVRLQECLYRIGLEALNNALKHSGAADVTFRFYTLGDLAVLEVTDDGHGFTPASPEHRGGMGLNNMRQRAKEMGGTLTIESAYGQGTTVTARIPCPELAASPVAPA